MFKPMAPITRVEILLATALLISVATNVYFLNLINQFV